MDFFKKTTKKEEDKKTEEKATKADSKSPDTASSEKKKAEKTPATTQPRQNSGGQTHVAQYTDILLSPRITEKATDLSTHNAYVFVVRKDSTKPEIKRAVHELYGVEPVRVRTVAIPSKQIQSRRGERGVKGGGKKAIVYLKQGETIELV